MPCVVPTCGAFVGAFKQFPLHESLVERWLEAILVGCGVKADDEGRLGPMEICHWHFGTSTSGEVYQEPAIFYNCDAEKVEIDSCRMCLKFYPISDLVSKDGKLSGKDIKSTIHDLVPINFGPDDFLQRICSSCLARLELLKSIRADFVNTDLAFHKLVHIALEDAAEIQRKTEKVMPKEELIIEPDAGDNGVEEYVIDEWTPPEPIIDMIVNKSDDKPKRKYTFTRRKRSKRTNQPKTPEASLKGILGRKCYICSVILESPNDLASHLTEKHSGMKNNRCDECSLDFPMLSVYNRHLSRHDQTERPEKCTFCPLRFGTQSGQKLHENKLHGTSHPIAALQPKRETAICETCGKSYPDMRMLRTHISRKHTPNAEKPKCKICAKTFVTNVTLFRHMQVHSETKPFDCGKCDASFSRLIYLKTHEHKVHEGENPHICTTCKQEFKSAIYLYQHRRVVHRMLPPLQFTSVNPQKSQYLPPCALCDETYYKSADLQDHISKVHANVDYPYVQCPQCPRKFLSKQALAQHKPTHTDRCVCKLCGKRFRSTQGVRIHMESVHENHRQYSCSECPGKTFKSYSSLYNHMHIHTKEKQYACDFCEKMFMRKDQLTIHRRTHTGEKPFECPHCFKRFGDDGTFSKHKKRCQQVKKEG